MILLKKIQTITVNRSQEGFTMDEQTRKLLEECCSGCRMAVESFEQIKEYVKDTEFRKLINDYTEKHRCLEDEAVSLLKEAGNEAVSPGVMASTLSRFTTEIKLTFNSDNTQIARLLIDGCAMGIKTLGEKAHQYDKADNIGSFNTPGVLLTDAVIFALGGSHLEMGEHMLCKEYFPNSNLGMTEELENSIITYYDFMTAYQNLLRDGGKFNSITVTSADGSVNIKDWEPATGSIITLGKEFDERQVIHFLNFINANSTSWRDLDGSMPEPSVVGNFTVTIQLPSGKNVGSAWIASPDTDYGASRALAFSQNGTELSITIPSLKYWSMFVLEYE